MPWKDIEERRKCVVAERDRHDDLIDSLAAQGIAYVPYFPLGGVRLTETCA